MSAVPAPSEQEARARRFPAVERSTWIRAAVILGVLLFAVLAVPSLVGTDWIVTFTSVAIYAVAACGFGLLYGRVGMISLGQVALLSIGCWAGARLSFATSIPFPILLLAVGVATGIIGVLVGLPALRLSGLYLALITLMFAGATTVVLSLIDFPNGGHGFTGRSAAGELSTSTPQVRRPSIAESDPAYFRYVVIACAILFLLVLIHIAGKPGRAWASIRESEPAALSAGVNITFYKLWAFGLASFITGVAGCLYAAEIGVPRANQFSTQDSLLLAATSLIGGIFSLWGAVIAGAFQQLLPFLFSAQWGVDSNFLLTVFGAGLLQVLLTAPGGLIDQFPKDMANLYRLAARKVPVSRQAALGIGSVLALFLGIVLLVVFNDSPLVGLVVVMSSPALAAYSLD